MESRAGDSAYRFVSNNPWFVLLMLVLLMGLAVLGLVDLKTGQPRITIDPSTDSMLPADDPAGAYFAKVRRQFGSEETLLVMVSGDDIFTPENLAGIKQLTEKIEKLDSVERVSSLATALNIRSEQGELRIDPFFDEVPRDAAALSDLRERALSDPIYAGNLVSDDGTASLINVHLLDLSEQEILASGVDAEITRLSLEQFGSERVSIAGSPHIKAEMNRAIVDNTMLLVPLSWLGMGLWAFMVFRTLRGVLIPLVAIQISLLGTFAFVAVVFGSLNIITVAAPPILVVFGLAYTIHVLTCYNDALRGNFGPWRDRREAVCLALRRVAVPTVFTGLTTAIGFLSLLASPLPAVRQFGVFCGVGALVTTVVALTFAPAVLNLLPIPRHVRDGRGDIWMARALEWIAALVRRHRRRILIVWSVLALVALAGIPQLSVSTSTVKDFKQDNPVRIDFETVNERLEGANAINVVLEASDPGGFLEPANLVVLEEVGRWVESQPEVGGTTSFVDYLKAINRGFHDDADEYLEVPASRELVSQLLLLGANDELEQFIDSDYQIANMVVRTRSVDTDEVSALADRIEGRLQDLGDGLEGAVTGNAVLLSRTMDDIAVGQARSLVLALVTIYGVLVVLFTSVRMGFLALLPNAVPVAFFFGILGWFGFPLNTSTSLVACLVLGIAVDDTIHLLVQFNDASKRRGDEDLGVVEALRIVGPPVTYTTGALVVGFMFMIPSVLQTVSDFGILCALTLALAWMIDLTLTPALAMGMRIVTIWDLLTLDLGEKPHHSIPLFRGLRQHQARQVALLTAYQRVPARTQLISVGGPVGEMFVVIDGELSASVERDGERVHLRKLVRGDVIGEVGIFVGKRTADVHSETAVRLIRLTEENLERLARWRPRIANKLFSNLSTVLAERLANVTTRVR